MRRLATLASVLAIFGCRATQPPVPTSAGVSLPLRYPVLLIGQASLDVRDSEAALTSITGASSLNLVERRIVDSAGHVFTVTRAAPIAGQPSVLLSMGTAARRWFVDVADQGALPWREVQALVLAEVNDARSTWAGDARAVARVQSLTDAPSLIAACRESSAWTR